MIKRYGIKTKSGNWYYVENHSHLFQHSTWFIFREGRKFYLLALRHGYSDDPKNILAKNIISIKDFIGLNAMYFKHRIEKDQVWGQVPNQTSKIIDFIEFQ
jgi:hypothetical protein